MKYDVTKVIKLRKTGASTYKIASKLGIPRPTVSRYLIRNGYRSYKLTDVNVDTVNDKEDLGEFLGAFAADGTYYKSVYKGGHKYVTKISFSGNELIYAKKLRNILNRMFKKKPFLNKNDKYNVIILRYNSRKLIKFIQKYLYWKGKKTYSIKLRNLNHSNEFLKGFVRGFFDCDGFANKNQRKASMFCVSKKLMKQINEILIKFEFQPQFKISKDKRRSNRKPLYFVDVTRDQASRFVTFIRPRNSKRLRKWARPDLKSPIEA